MAATVRPFRIVQRRNFGRLKEVLEVPDLLRLQKESYERFLQYSVPPESRADIGLQGLFKSVFPISDYAKTATLEFVRYVFHEPKYTVEECRERGITYAAPMRVTVRLVTWDVDPDTAIRDIRDVKEQEVYFGEVPVMTENGTFIINGAERVVVSQLHRSPGVFFESDKGRTHASGKFLYSASIIPNRGSWIDFEFDHKDILHVRIDRRRKMPATVLLKALGFTTQDLFEYFYPVETISLLPDGGLEVDVDPSVLEGGRAPLDILDPKTGEVLARKGDKLGRFRLKRILERGIERLGVPADYVIGRVLADDVIDEETGIVFFDCNQEITPDMLAEMRVKGVTEIKVLVIDNLRQGPYLRNTMLQDKTETPEEAAVEVYRRQRPGDPATPEQARAYVNGLFSSSVKYDLSPVGRLKMNYKLGQDVPLEQTTLRKEDFLLVVKYLLDLKMGKSNARVDDIDQLSNRRVRAVGELLENQFRVGMQKMERAVKEKMTMSVDLATQMPLDLVNTKPVTAAIKEYFGSSQLSQFMDQTNPLTEVTNKRRLSALGPGGLSRERAGFEVRDVHATHYGRICPVETPEGPNIGLISSLATYARVNDFGFIEAPYRKVVNRRLTDEVVYLTAMEEENQTIAEATVPVDEQGNIVGDLVQARRNEEYIMANPEDVTLVDVSPSQIVSVAAALIPFLEHDDANRALMGSNMQRQAVPLMRPEAPLVGTNLEWIVARDSGAMVIAKQGGTVEYVSADKIVVRPDATKSDPAPRPDTYDLVKYRRSNQNTCINQVPLVRKGQRVKAGQVLADSYATRNGELALGKNVLVAFMPWGGYNYEDSILLSERLVREDVYTSIHIEEFECHARDTKLGREEITRDIPNVNEDALRNLDAGGIVRIGAEVKTGDILVGKVTPRGETQLSPEEKLLRAIFGEKAADVKDASLRVPPGIEGIVIGAKVFARGGGDRDEHTRDFEQAEEARLRAEREEEVRITTMAMKRRLMELLSGQKLAEALKDKKGKVILKGGTILSDENMEAIDIQDLARARLVEAKAMEENVLSLMEILADQVAAIDAVYQDRMQKLRRGDDLQPGIIKTVKVYVAIKRKIQLGDKMAGRHGNKGVVSTILPIEDMPYMMDGTPVDVVLNPLGVPSRMNVGQIFETHLGWACKEIGKQLDQLMRKSLAQARKKAKRVFNTPSMKSAISKMSDEEFAEFVRHHAGGLLVATPVFDGAMESEIKDLLREAGLPESGKTILFDGRTGEPFESDVTVGSMYIMKLHHLVDEKIHARSTGPYSLVTQQPLGGKAQFGGQRLGEMEVWALEAYGAAYTLQEFLTVKSDDVAGRTATFDSIVKGEYEAHPGLPESFNVLVKELKALAVDVELVEGEEGAPGR